MAIGGQGFFSVALAKGTTNGQPVFDERQFFTRAGDVALDKDGYLVNGAGYYLQGWPVDAAGNPDRTILDPDPGEPAGLQPGRHHQNRPRRQPAGGCDDQRRSPPRRSVYDSLGRLHTVNLSFTSTATNAWNLDLTCRTTSTPRRGARSGCASAPPPRPRCTDGTIGAFTGASGSVSLPATSAAGDPATLTFTADFGQGAQTVNLALGQFGLAQGLTQYSGTEILGPQQRPGRRAARRLSPASPSAAMAMSR